MVEEDKDYRMRKRFDKSKGTNQEKLALWAKWQRQRAALEAETARAEKRVK